MKVPFSDREKGDKVTGGSTFTRLQTLKYSRKEQEVALFNWDWRKEVIPCEVQSDNQGCWELCDRKKSLT